MSLAPAARLGAYEIVSLIGSGGMGEVYRARDPRLARDVAIKVLPAAFSGDPDRLHRFEQEARAAAALNHPNIIAVYDIGTHDGSPYIVSELLDGQSLRERLRAPHGPDASVGGAIPVRKAIDYAVQAANGLAAAHEKGIVHRDLKPENLFITADGRVKILDFGLAKLTQAETVGMGIGLSTVTSPDTQPGVVMGTFGYMSPEQVRGAAVDHRSDIFAFGTILYELLAGRHAFRGDSVADTMSAILKDDPDDLPVVERHLPPALARIVDRCLEKNPAARFQSTKDLAFALESLSSHSGTAEVLPAATLPARRRTRTAWTIAAVSVVAAVLAVAAAATIFLNRPDVDDRATRFLVHPPDGWTIADTANSLVSAAALAVSPDGGAIAFVGTKAGQRVLYLRARGAIVPQPLRGTEGVTNPFWSPDSRSLGFFANGKLKKIDVSGGPPVELCEAPTPVGGAWSPEGLILFAPGTRTALQQVPAAGGVPTAATVLKPDEISHSRPSFLPDGRHYLVRVLTNTDSAIDIGSVDSPDRVRMLTNGSNNVRYSEGHLLFVRDRTLMAQPFDVKALRITGDPAPIAQNLRTTGSQQYGVFSVSANGVLAYQEGAPSTGYRLVWYDRKGNAQGSVGDPAVYGDVRLSPDGRKAAVTLYDSERNTRDIWIVDLLRGVRTRFTSEAVDDAYPVWSADGARLAFSSRRKSVFDIFSRPVSGAGAEAKLAESAASKLAMAWSPDGRSILFVGGVTQARVSMDVWVLPVGGSSEPVAFMASEFNEEYADFSPDGRWVAYTSTETGRTEVYVAPFPGPGAKVIVSTGGGTHPHWRRDGAEILYLTTDMQQLMAAAVSVHDGAIDIGTVDPLFEIRGGAVPGSIFDVSADGKRILALIPPPDAQQRAEPLTVVLNWPATLKK